MQNQEFWRERLTCDYSALAKLVFGRLNSFDAVQQQPSCWPVENVFFLGRCVVAKRAFSQTAKVELLRISQLPYPFYQPILFHHPLLLLQSVLTRLQKLLSRLSLSRDSPSSIIKAGRLPSPLLNTVDFRH